MWRDNPFPSTDADRHAIWEILVRRDIDAFLAGDWDSAAADFQEDGFTGYSGPSNPDHWRIRFPSLAAYRDEWLRQAREFTAVSPAREDKDDFLYRATVLRDIEIAGDRAMAHKKFDAATPLRDGGELVLNWQTLYWLRRSDGRWRITGFLGYLPNPMPQATPAAPGRRIEVPAGASQHRTAGPYSPVLRISRGSLIALSGQGPIDADGRIVGTTIEEQAAYTLENCRRQLEAAGAGFPDVFKATVYLADMSEWAAFNEVYRRCFSPPYPARTAIQAVLWGGIKVEIDLLAAPREGAA